MTPLETAQQRGFWGRILDALRPANGRGGAAHALTENQFYNIINIASDAIITTSENLTIVNFNSGAEEIFGYTAEEIIGRHLNTLIPHRYHRTHNEHVHNFARSGVPARRMAERRQIWGLRKDGDEFPCEASISQLHIEGECLFTVVLRDISDRKRRELRHTLLAQAGELLAGSLDIDTTLKSVAGLMVPQVADWCVVFVNHENGQLVREAISHRDPAVEAALREAVLLQPVANPGHPVLQVMNSRQAVMIPEMTEEVFHGLAENADHAQILRQTGARSAIVVPMVARNETRGAIALFSTLERRDFDDDDLALAEELARRSALALDNARLYRKARSAIEARDDVLAVVSHDLGNPLSAIRIGTTLLLSTLTEEERETGGWKHIVGIRNSAEQMERLIKDLLEVKRIEAGQLSIERDKVSVAPLVAEAIELLSGIAEDKNIKLHAAMPDGIPAIYADRERVLQTFSNLVGNAVKFTPAGGEVRIEAAARGEEVVLTVVDNGPGISAADLPHIFDRYWQAKARRRGRQGIGLGLVIVKGIVEAHGGRVWVESEPGVGSRFNFSVPVWSDRYELLDE